MVLLAALVLAGCYNDESLKNQMNELNNRVTALEEWKKQISDQMTAFQNIVNGKCFITSVNEQEDNSLIIKYVKVENGTAGEEKSFTYTPPTQTPGTGTNSVIGAEQGEDGRYYWTLNGEALTDKDGNKIYTTGPTVVKMGSEIYEGSVDINENLIQTNAVYISTDGEKTWYKISGENGKDALNGFFKNVEKTQDGIKFTIAGTSSDEVITVPYYNGIGLKFIHGGNEISNFESSISVGVINEITYDFLSEEPNDYKVFASILPNKEGWSASIDESAKKITITSTEYTENTAEEALLQVIVTDNRTNSRIYMIKMSNKGLSQNSNNEFEITTFGELEYVAKMVNSRSDVYNGSGVKYILTKDIYNAGGTQEFHTPIGKTGAPFTGTFDGRGYTISGLNIEGPKSGSEDGNYGLFGLIDGATIKNVKVSGTVTAACSVETSIGGIAGKSLNSANITNCESMVNINVTAATDNKATYAAGILGFANGDVVIEGCINKGNITLVSKPTTNTVAIGAIVGHTWGAVNTLTLTDCINEAGASVSMEEGCNTTNCYVGGLVAFLKAVGPAKAHTIEDCLNKMYNGQEGSIIKYTTFSDREIKIINNGTTTTLTSGTTYPAAATQAN